MLYDGFDLLCRELSLEPATFFKQIQQDPDRVMEQLRLLPVADLPLVLGEDLTLEGNQAPFITKGTDLRRHLKAVFNRISSNCAFSASPLILPSAEINRFLKEKISCAFADITRKMMDQQQLGRIYDVYEKNQDLKGIATYFGKLIDPHLSSPAIIKGFLTAFTSESAMGSIEENTKAAFVAMAVLQRHEAFVHDENASRKNNLVEMGMAILFQDIACTVDGINHDPNSCDHAAASAIMAQGMKLSDRCIETIRWHHRSTDINGAPILMIQEPPLFERLAVLINAFIRCISNRQFGLTVDQAIYVLEHYARLGYYDTACIQTLARISVGEGKQRIISKSFEFSWACPAGNRPVLWDVRTKLPNRFICTRTDCPLLSAEAVVLYEPIVFSHPAFNLDIPAGHYYKCIELTRRFNRWMLEQRIFKLID